MNAWPAYHRVLVPTYMQKELRACSSIMYVSSATSQSFVDVRVFQIPSYLELEATAVITTPSQIHHVIVMLSSLLPKAEFSDD